MKFKWRKWNRVTHRDLGYFLLGMTLIYSISGIAINHIDDWNPNYIVNRQEFIISDNQKLKALNQEEAKKLLKTIDSQVIFKKHYYLANQQYLKYFIKNGNALINITKKTGYIETIKKRPIFYEVNFLHYNPSNWWTWFSDFFAAGLILLAITGLFVLKGNNGIKWRGAIIAGVGIIIPILFLLFI
ncbi:MAG: PepSY-associated TM helix domain-containing protein [Bacteroidota bacterium]|nr:PepSY-associated TM helix domain-containing protein [Bacteroidota bacterium]